MNDTYQDLSLQFSAFANNLIAQIPTLIFAVLLLGVFVYVSRPVASVVVKPLKRKLQSSRLVELLLMRSIRLLIILLGVYLFLCLVGLTGFAVAILSGTGVGGIIIGFAFRDIAENFIASLLLSIQRPFRLKDVIHVEGHTGVVQKVTARATTLVDFDGNHIQIPNAAVYKNVIKNLTANPRMRGHFVVGIGYDSDIRDAQALSLEVLQRHAAVLDDPEPQVLVGELGSSTANLDLFFWIDSESHAVNKVSSSLMLEVLAVLEEHNISMPDDAREIVFPEGVPVSLQGESVVRELPKPAKETKQTDSATRQETTTANSRLRSLPNPAPDLSSDADTIRQQAEQARVPEEGDNIF